MAFHLTWNFSDQRPYFKSDRCFYAYRYGYNHKFNVRISFQGPDNMGKDTKIDFLLQILKRLSGIKDLAHFSQAAILFLLIKKFAQGCQNGISLILVQDMLEHQNQQKKPCSASSSCLIHDSPRLYVTSYKEHTAHSPHYWTIMLCDYAM